MKKYILTVPALGFCDTSITAKGIGGALLKAEDSLMAQGCRSALVWSTRQGAFADWQPRPDNIIHTKVYLPDATPVEYIRWTERQQPWWKHKTLFVGWAIGRVRIRRHYRRYSSDFREKYTNQIADVYLREIWEPGVHESYGVPIRIRANPENPEAPEQFVFLHEVPASPAKTELIDWLNEKGKKEYAESLLSGVEPWTLLTTWKEVDQQVPETSNKRPTPECRRAISVELWEDFNQRGSAETGESADASSYSDPLGTGQVRRWGPKE